MKKQHLVIIIFGFLFTTPPSVFGQKTCYDYSCVIGRVKKAMSDKNYRLAFEQLESAESYLSKNVLEISKLRKQLFNVIEKEKQEAINARNDAKTEKERAESLLKDLRKTSDQAVELLLSEIDRNIFQLEYDSTFEKCRIALNLKSETYEQQIKERVLEIAFWYTEIDMSKTAIKYLSLLNINALSNRTNIIEVIKQNCTSQFFTFLENRYYPVLKIIVGGEFYMGRDDSNEDEKPTHKVLVDTFKISESEVTVWQFFVFVNSAHKEMLSPPVWGWTGNHPIVNVNWNDANDYINWINERFNYKCRLPFESEWEYIAKSSEKIGGKLLDRCWYFVNSKNKPHPVKSLKANELGLFDIQGNVWEWCFDYYDKNYYSLCAETNIQHNISGPKTGKMKVLRGGSWSDTEKRCQVTMRNYTFEYTKNDNIGFRIAFNN